ncbi:hypothetical protein [Halorubrum halodurans]|uniref:hypothetical protein n=1 Tax=Halorubrum halodurans TaxID=1383851 RepID=UPI0015C67AAB|nr:hypothetical protein [Halorubrum halodurans]
MNGLLDDFDDPELPGEDLEVYFGKDEVAFLGERIGQSITTDPESSVYVEDWI